MMTLPHPDRAPRPAFSEGHNLSRDYQIDFSRHLVTKHRGVGDFLRAKRVRNGFHIIGDGDLPVVVLNQDRGFETTVVFFHAAIEKHYTLPVLTGLGISKNVDVNRIFISDPSLNLSESLNLAWFAGSSDQPLQPILENIIDKFIHHHTASERIVFFGASGGGFASLYYSSRFQGSIAIASNPQTSIEKYVPAAVRKFSRVCFDSEWPEPGARLPHSVVTDLTTIYSNPTGNSVVYIQNRGDTQHISHHLEPFLDRLHPANDVKILFGDWGPGHAPPDKDVLVGVLHAVEDSRWDSQLSQMGFTQHRTWQSLPSLD